MSHETDVFLRNKEQREQSVYVEISPLFFHFLPLSDCIKGNSNNTLTINYGLSVGEVSPDTKLSNSDNEMMEICVMAMDRHIFEMFLDDSSSSRVVFLADHLIKTHHFPCGVLAEHRLFSVSVSRLFLLR